jgi:non-canonical poly(A) RNA polymerase PAPD5/7
MEPRPEEVYARNLLVENISQVVAKSCGKSARTIVFGSYATGIYLPHSDIDIVVLDSEFSNPLNRIAKELRKQPFVSEFQLITKARVPLVKFKDSETAIQVDISFESTSGPANTAVVLDFLREYPQVKRLHYIFLENVF